MKNYIISTIILLLIANCAQSAEIEIVPTATSDDSELIQSAMDGLQDGDTLLLSGDFVIKHTIYLPSNFTWILNGSITLAGDADLDLAGYADSVIDARRRTGITEKAGGATNIDMSGGTYYGNSVNYPNSMRYLNFGSVTNSNFHDMHITEVTDDNFTLGPGCNNNECRNILCDYSLTGNALTDKGDHNTWIDCIAANCLGPDGDGWTPKCRYSTFIRCVAANNVGPGFGMYAREEGYADNKHVGAHIVGNKFIDCISYGSVRSSGFSFNISGNCPGAIIRDNFIQAVCYNNQGSGVHFRNKDDAEAGIVENNEIDIVCYGNKGLNKSGNQSSWAGGLGMENDNSTTHNLIENVFGSIVSYDNVIDVNTRGGTNCNITVYHPEGRDEPNLDDKSSGNNTVTVVEFNSSDSTDVWCQTKYNELAATIITPSGSFDDSELIQGALDDLREGATLRLEGDFFIAKTIYFPSNFTWKLMGTLTLAADAELDEVGWVETGIDARRRTGISEKSGGATNIDMSGGTYYGNASNYPNSMRFINFVSVTNSKFHDMHITEVTDDNFTLGPGCNNNECHRLTGSFAGGNALTDKGDHNKWYDCIAEDCASDGWTPKCRYSEFHRCIGRRNAGPGFGMYARVDGSGIPIDLGEAINGNKFYDCEAYENDRGGFDFDISSTCGEGGEVRDNYIQALVYNNKMQGVFFRNKRPNSIIENNVVNIIAYGNLGQRNDGSSSSFGGGVSAEGSTESPVRGITGWVICYDNKDWDVNTNKATNCNITVYNPNDQSPAVLRKGDASNILTEVSFNCGDHLDAWCQYKYCGAPTPPIPGAPSGLAADVVSSSQIDLSWTDNAENEAAYIIEQKTTGSFIPIATVDANVTTFSVADLSGLTMYTYRVQGFNISGYSDYSAEVSATTESETGIVIQETSEERDLIHKIYPNPFHETTQIVYTITKDCFVSVRVYDTSGRMMNTLVQESQQQGQYSVTFDRRNLSCGTYYYRICAGNISETQKIVLLK